jgi:CheY-like chemotaxis protein
VSDPDPARYSIFLAEDNRADVYLLNRALKDAGVQFEITVAQDGAEALALLRQQPRPHLIVLDLNLPKVDGGAVLASVRENPKLADVPVVILTSSSAPRDRAKARQLRATEYIVKPLDLSGFYAIGRRLKAILDASGSANETSSISSVS